MFDKKEYMKKYNKQYCQENKKYFIEYHKQWQKDNSEKIKEYINRWYKNNCKKIREHRNNKRRTDLKFNLSNKMGTLMWYYLKKNKAGRAWETLVNYTHNDLIEHLKKTMPKGYTWQDYMSGKLHIDHIIPISVHNFTKPEHLDFKRCWALDNLRLLPAKKNRIKFNKLTKPFQPALKLIIVGVS